MRSTRRLLEEGSRIVVVDTETTGLGRDDRVVEVALVTLDAYGTVLDAWDTLVNPRRDVGPTHIHGVTDEMVADAPAFAEVLPTVLTLLDGAVLAAHNLPFDTRMLDGELRRAGVAVDFGAGFDTLAVTRCRLGVACRRYGVATDGAHRALRDAHATAELLVAVAHHFASTPTTAASATRRPPAPASCRRLCRDTAGRLTAHDPS